MGNPVTVIRYPGQGDSQVIKTFGSEALRLMVEELEDAVYCSDAEAAPHAEFGLGFMYGALYTLRGDFPGDVYDAYDVVCRAYSECNARYGDSEVLAGIIARFRRRRIDELRAQMVEKVCHGQG